MAINIHLTGEQVEAIRDILKSANNLETDERQLLNGLLEIAENHPGIDQAWTYHQPHMEGT
jgi:hypothetical protein